MNKKIIGRFISKILFLEAAFFIPAILICIYDGYIWGAKSFLYSAFAAIGAGIVLALICKGASGVFYAKEGFVCVAMSWIAMSFIGALPFVFTGVIPNFLDALFETVSGFTTTGATVILNIEKIPRALVYWRCFMHWIGGMGVLVFLLAIAPPSGEDSGFTIHLLRAESPGPDVGKLVPRIRKTAMILYIIYMVLTLVDIIFLLFGGMSVFESVCTAFGTASTGGCGIKSDSMASYSIYIQTVTIVFMLFFGINFTCLYLIVMRQFVNVLKDSEFRLYLGIFAVCTGLIAVNLSGFYETIGETIKHSAFQVAAIMTTTGYATTDFDLWPSFSKAVLMVLMFIGACAGSTGGGFKIARVLLLQKSLKRSIQKMLSPQKVAVIRVDGRRISEGVIQNTNIYLIAYIAIMAISFIVISVDGFSITTNFTAVSACFNNIGAGLELVGPTGNYASFGAVSKIVLMVDMLAGRLEIFPILILFMRNTWKRA